MKESPPPVHSDSLSFLLSQLGALSAARFHDVIAPLGLTPRGYGVLSQVTSDPGPTQQQLADALGIHRNNMVGLIDALEAAGWVERRRDPSDRRAFRISRTPEGAEVTARAGRAIAALDEEFSRTLSTTDAERVVRLLQRIADDADLNRGVHPAMAQGHRAEGAR